MTFANPLLLAGLAAAVLPVVLHLLGRARARTLPWGATLFLQADPGESMVGRLRDRLLLALRCLAIALLAIALARPDTAASAAAAAGEVVILIVDASPSTLHPETSTTRFELIRRAALQRLSRLKQGDQAGLVVLGVATSADIGLTPDLQAIATQLLYLSPGPLPADLAEGERRARVMLNDNAVDGGEIDLIADRQRATWESIQQMADPGVASRVVAMPVGSTRNENAGIESIELLNPPAIAGRPARFAITLRNDGDVPQGQLSLRLSPGRGEADTGVVAIDARSKTKAFRTVTPQRPGSAIFTATLAATGTPDDDVVRQSIDVLAPPRVRRVGANDATTQPVNPFADADVLLIDGVLPDLATLAAVERFVAGGGGLLIAPGPGASPSTWNVRFWKSGFGLSPFAAGDVQTDRLMLPEQVAPLLWPSANQPNWTQLGLTRHWVWASTPGETVLARLGNDPLILERRFGRGRVTTLAFPLSGRWTAGGDAGSYRGLADELVSRLIDRPVNRNVDIGVPLESTFKVGRDRFLVMTRPDGRTDRVNLVVSGEQAVFRYTRTDLPGRYTVRGLDRPTEDWFVRPDPNEANLSLLTDGELAGLIRPTGVQLQDPQSAEIRGQNAPAVVLLALVGGVLGMEMWLSGRFLPRRGGA
jgi:hypothetical protein